MQMTNLTPFPAVCFGSFDLQGRACDTVVMRVGYAITLDPATGGAQLQVQDQNPQPLRVEDDYWAPEQINPNASDSPPGEHQGTESKPFYHYSVRQETDLAPFKPRCDLLVIGNAYAPQGKATDSWPIQIRLHSRTEKSPTTLTPVLEKTLKVLPQGHFRLGLLGWTLTRAKTATQVPLRWENAFGGSCQVANPAHTTDTSQPEWLLNEVCFSNPLGGGWLDKRYERSLRKAGKEMPKQMLAPSLFYPKDTLKEPVLIKHPDGIVNTQQIVAAAAKYPLQPAGFGPIARSWAPRIGLSGTYDERWKKERWPLLPTDFDEGYWNCAPLDQQAPWPSADAVLEAWHLFDPRLAPKGYVQMALPGHRAFVMARLENGTPLPLPMLIDTLVLDTDTHTLHVVWRCRIPQNPLIASLEARFETDPTAPLLKWQSRTPTQGKETSDAQ
jgi:hypothetical protein